MSQAERPTSLAVAGAWGYIGRKFVQAARDLGIPTYVYDPGPWPDDLDAFEIERIEQADDFYDLPAEVFHLAMHPEHRQAGLQRLLNRKDGPPQLILNEKPMAEPESPQDCTAVIAAVGQTNACMLYDFPELFDPLTGRILEYLAQFRQLQIQRMTVQRSKDREDAANPRNYKRMVSIQYQESVHCLAFVLFVLARTSGNLSTVLQDPLTVTSQSERYCPPNPESYPLPVDGRCQYRLSLGGVDIQGCTDFKRHAPWSKRRTIEGLGDGQPFSIEVDYLEGHKRLILDGVDQEWDAGSDSYQAVLLQATRWARNLSTQQIDSGVYPHPTFARLTYQLSSVLWQSSLQQEAIRLESERELLSFRTDAQERSQ